jgi:hypothetical protein
MYVGDLQPSSREAKPVQISKEGALGGIFWRQDGKELYYLTLPGFAVMAVDVATSPEFQAGTPKMLFRVPGGVTGAGQLSNVSSPDGQRFVFLAPAPVITSTRLKYGHQAGVHGAAAGAGFVCACGS